MEDIKDTKIVYDIQKIIENFKDNGPQAIAKVIYKEISDYGNCNKCDYFNVLKENEQLTQQRNKGLKYIEENIQYLSKYNQDNTQFVIQHLEELEQILKGKE